MPVRNVIRVHSPNSYYHIYNRGHNKMAIYIDEQDYKFFIALIERCFGPKQFKDKKGRLLPWFGDKVKLHSYCLMPNHFHLLLHVGEEESMMSGAMQSLCTTYSMYFNKRHKRRGALLESVFKASLVLNDTYLLHISRYIHLNPKDYARWTYSSYKTYLGLGNEPWVITDDILAMFDSVGEYKTFIDDYLELRDELAELKYDLADHGQTYHNT